MNRIEWVGASRAIGVGAALKDNALTKEIIKRRGAIDEASLKAYGTIAGTIAGAALCAPLGPVAAVGCGIMGGIIGGAIGKLIPVAHGSTLGDLVAEEWNNYTVPQTKLAAKGVLSIVAYLTMREEAVKAGYSDSSLTAKGLPGAPLFDRWKPSQGRYQVAKSFETGNLQTWCNQAPGCIQTSNYCGAAGDIGLLSSAFPCRDFIWAYFYQGRFGPVGAPSDPIDLWAVGRDEVAYYHLQKNKNKGYTGAQACSGYMAGWRMIGAKGTNYFYDDGDKYACPTKPPTQVAKELLDKLEQVTGIGPPPASAGSSGGGTAVVVGGIAVAAAAAWFLL